MPLSWVPLMALANAGGSAALLGNPFVTAFANAGFAGLVVILLLTRVLVPKWVQDKTQSDADEWKALYYKEREAHQATREALIIASQRGDSGTEAAKLVTSILEYMRKQAEHEGGHRG